MEWSSHRLRRWWGKRGSGGGDERGRHRRRSQELGGEKLAKGEGEKERRGEKGNGYLESLELCWDGSEQFLLLRWPYPRDGCYDGCAIVVMMGCSRRRGAEGV